MLKIDSNNFVIYKLICIQMLFVHLILQYIEDQRSRDLAREIFRSKIGFYEYYKAKNITIARLISRCSIQPDDLTKTVIPPVIGRGVFRGLDQMFINFENERQNVTLGVFVVKFPLDITEFGLELHSGPSETPVIVDCALSFLHQKSSQKQKEGYNVDVFHVTMLETDLMLKYKSYRMLTSY
eukprot:UN30686